MELSLRRTWLVVALGTFSMVTCAGAWATEATSTVTLTVAKHAEVSVGNISAWAKGLTANGLPTPLTDGTKAWFDEGAMGDKWPGDGTNQWPYCKGAVGSSAVTVSANTPVIARIPMTSGDLFPLLQLDNGAHSLPGSSALVWNNGNGMYLPRIDREDLDLGVDDSTFLYVMVQREGYNDPAGTYKAQVTVEVVIK